MARRRVFKGHSCIRRFSSLKLVIGGICALESDADEPEPNGRDNLEPANNVIREGGGFSFEELRMSKRGRWGRAWATGTTRRCNGLQPLSAAQVTKRFAAPLL